MSLELKEHAHTAPATGRYIDIQRAVAAVAAAAAGGESSRAALISNKATDQTKPSYSMSASNRRGEQRL